MYDPTLITLLKMQPNYSQSSRENATPSSGTSPLASYKEVPPRGLLYIMGNKSICSGESTHLQLMWPRFSSQVQCLMWAEFAVGSLPSPGRFSLGSPVFPSPQKQPLENSVQKQAQTSS